MKVPPGVSGRATQLDINKIDNDTVKNELALLTLGNFEPLKFKVDCNQFMHEISEFKDSWVDYLPRTDRPNNRQALSLTNLPGRSYNEAPSLAEASIKAGRRLSELEFNQPTEVYSKCNSLSFLNEFMPIGRTFLVKCNIGGYFYPHRDQAYMPRESFRLIAFLNNCGPHDYDWLMEDKKVNIEQGRVYFVNTRLTHRTISWIDDSIHLICNIPFTTENVAKVVANLRYSH